MLQPQNRCSGKARHRSEKYHNGPPISSVSLRMEKEVVDRPPCREGWASSAATTSAQSVRMRCSRRRGGHDQNPATSPVPIPYGVYGIDSRRKRRKQSKATFEVPARSIGVVYERNVKTETSDSRMETFTLGAYVEKLCEPVCPRSGCSSCPSFFPSFL
jgi:hypothetical protein